MHTLRLPLLDFYMCLYNIQQKQPALNSSGTFSQLERNQQWKMQTKSFSSHTWRIASLANLMAYTVWKVNHPPLPTNYNVCNRRTHSLAWRLAQTPETFKIYGNIVLEQLTQGFIEQLQSSSMADAHYIPHHPVKKESSTTPIQIAYNCSCCRSQT